MFGLSWAQLGIIAIVAVFVLGPERIPTVVSWATAMIRKAQRLSFTARSQLTGDIGSDLEELRRQIAELRSLQDVQGFGQLRELHPRHLLFPKTSDEQPSPPVRTP